MDRIGSSEVLLTFINFLVLGIVYQEKFRSRSDWISLDSLFYETEVSDFLKSSLCYEDSVGYYHDRIDLRSKFKDLLDFRPATNRKGIERKVCEQRIIYPNLHSANLPNLFFYHYSLDYVALPDLPVRLWRLVNPLSPYYKITSYIYEFEERKPQIDVLRDAIFTTVTGQKSTLTVTFEYAIGSKLKQFIIETRDLRLSVDLEKRLISYHDPQKSDVLSIDYGKDLGSVVSLVG